MYGSHLGLKQTVLYTQSAMLMITSNYTNILLLCSSCKSICKCCILWNIYLHGVEYILTNKPMGSVSYTVTVALLLTEKDCFDNSPTWTWSLLIRETFIELTATGKKLEFWICTVVCINNEYLILKRGVHGGLRILAYKITSISRKTFISGSLWRLVRVSL